MKSGNFDRRRCDPAKTPFAGLSQAPWHLARGDALDAARRGRTITRRSTAIRREGRQGGVNAGGTT